MIFGEGFFLKNNSKMSNLRVCTVFSVRVLIGFAILGFFKESCYLVLGSKSKGPVLSVRYNQVSL